MRGFRRPSFCTSAAPGNGVNVPRKLDTDASVPIWVLVAPKASTYSERYVSTKAMDTVVSRLSHQNIFMPLW